MCISPPSLSQRSATLIWRCVPHTAWMGDAHNTDLSPFPSTPTTPSRQHSPPPHPTTAPTSTTTTTSLPGRPCPSSYPTPAHLPPCGSICFSSALTPLHHTPPPHRLQPPVVLTGSLPTLLCHPIHTSLPLVPSMTSALTTILTRLAIPSCPSLPWPSSLYLPFPLPFHAAFAYPSHLYSSVGFGWFGCDFAQTCSWLFQAFTILRGDKAYLVFLTLCAGGGQDLFCSLFVPLLQHLPRCHWKEDRRVILFILLTA